MLRPQDESAWSRFVESDPEATFFHKLAWRDAVAKAFGHAPCFLTAKSGDDLVGVLPLFQIDSVIAGRLLVSMPYATYGGILAADEAARDALLTEARAIASGSGARVLELRSLKAADSRLPVLTTHATFVRDLPNRDDNFESYLPRKARAAARKAAEQNELTVEFSERVLGEVWDLYSRSMRRLGSPNYPQRFFENIVSAAKGQCVVQMVRCAGRPVAGLITFLHRQTVMPYFVGIDDRVGIYGLSHFLYRESMRWGVENGYRSYDFGRSRIDNKGPFEFKRLCGFEPQILAYQRYVPRDNRAPDLAPTSPRWSMARRVWRYLPLSLTRPLGGWLSKSIPG